MIDRTYAGVRCRTRYLLRTVKGDLPRGSLGTVVYAMDYLGRSLLLVKWDQGMSVPVFAHEIGLQGAPAAPLHSPTAPAVIRFSASRGLIQQEKPPEEELVKRELFRTEDYHASVSSRPQRQRGTAPSDV